MVSTIIIQAALIIASEAFWVSSASAQLVRVIKTRDVHGLSAVTITLYAAGNVAWMTYFATLHLWLAFAGDMLILLVTVILLGYILRDRQLFYRGVASIAVIGPTAGLALIMFPASSGWIGVSLNVVAEIPQMYRIIRYKKVSGISVHSQLYAVGAIICTLAYGLMVHATPLVVGCAQGIVFISITLLYRYLYRTKRGGFSWKPGF